MASTRVEDEHRAVVREAERQGAACTQSHTTKLTRIYTNGTLGYEVICDKFGMVTYDDTPRDEYLDKVFAALVLGSTVEA